MTKSKLAEVEETALPASTIPNKVTKITEELPCKLNDVEWNSRVHELTDAYTNLQQKETTKASMMAQMGADIKAAKAHHAKLSNIVATRQETREVTVEMIYDYMAGTVKRVRTDNSEVLSEREMIDAERQGTLVDADSFIEEARDEERDAEDDELSDDELDD